MEHEHLIQLEANNRMMTAEEDGHRDRLARSARVPRNSGARRVFATGLSRVSDAAREGAESVRAWMTSPPGPQEQCC